MKRAQRGTALILVLVTITVVATMGAAIGTLVAAHYSRATVDRDAARALDAAESAINYQVQRISAAMNLGNSQILYDGSSNLQTATYALVANPIPVTAKTYGGGNTTLNGFLGLGDSDYCRCWIEYPGAPSQTLDLTSSTTLYIYGEARVNGVIRTVRAKAGASDIFKNWAVFGNDSVTIGGSFSVTPVYDSAAPNTPLGIVGSNGSVDIAKDTSAVGGQIVYGTGVPDNGFPYTYGGRPAVMTPINDLAEAAFRDGGYTANNNTGIAKFSVTNDNAAHGLVTKGKNTEAMLTDGTFASGAGYPVYLSSASGVTRNYYMTRLDGSNVTIWADVSNGPINLWVNNTNTNNSANDSISGNIDITAYKTKDSNGVPVRLAENSPLFHIYYSNQYGSLNITGGGSTQNIYAMFYLYNTTSTGTPFGTFTTGGTVTINGAMYANSIGDGSGGGNFSVNYPSTVGAGGTTNGALFAMTSPWTEYNPVRGN